MSNRSRLAQHEANQAKQRAVEMEIEEFRSAAPGSPEWFRIVDIATKYALRAELRRMNELVGE